MLSLHPFLPSFLPPSVPPPLLSFLPLLTKKMVSSSGGKRASSFLA